MSLRPHQWAFLFMASVFFSGCVTTSPVIRIFPNDFPKVSHRTLPTKVKGEACGSGSFIGLRLTPGPKLYNAFQEALAMAGSHYNALAEVKVYEQRHTNFFITYYCFIVEGFPVRYGQAALPPNYTPAHISNPKGTKESQWNF